MLYKRMFDREGYAIPPSRRSNPAGVHGVNKRAFTAIACDADARTRRYACSSDPFAKTKTALKKKRRHFSSFLFIIFSRLMPAHKPEEREAQLTINRCV